MRYVVADGTQVHHRGRLHGAGEEVEAAPDEAVEWLARGWAVEVPRKPKS